MNKADATFKANLLLTKMTVDELAKKLDISKPTLYTRLAEKNWKLGEIALLEKM